MKSGSIATAFAISLTAVCGYVDAQQATPSAGETAPASAPAPAPAVPIVDPAFELKDAALLETLKRGGLVLYIRHALQIPPTSESCDKSNLTEVGETQARKVGEAIRGLGIPVGEVKSSQPCRAQDTARLLGLGKVTVTADLNPIGPGRGDDPSAARMRLLAATPPPASNTLLVSHVHGGRDKAAWIQLEIAEIIVYRPDGKGDTRPIARIRLEAWDELARVAAGGAAKQAQ